MAKIKRVSAEIKEGITNAGSGAMAIIVLERTGVIRGLKAGVHVKRPNQYKG